MTADFGHTLTPLATIESHVLKVTTSPFVIDGSWDDFHVDTGSGGGLFNVTLPMASEQWGRKLTVTHVAGTAPLRLYAAQAVNVGGPANGIGPWQLCVLGSLPRREFGRCTAIGGREDKLPSCLDITNLIRTNLVDCP